MKLYRTLCGILCLLTNISYSQNLIQGTTNSGFSGTKFPDARIQNIKPSKDLFNSANSFIENIGQYGNSMPGYENMGSVKYGFEGFEMPVLFTTKGLIYLHRKIEGIKNKKELEIAIKKVPDDEIERERRVTDKIITMEWLGANTNVEIIVEDKSDAYHTYGMLKGKAIGFKKITYKELYPGIDLVFYFRNSDKIGFEYSLILRPGANLGQIKMKYAGETKKIVLDKKGNLFAYSSISGISHTVPISFTCPPDNVFQLYINKLKIHLLPWKFRSLSPHLIEFFSPQLN